MDGQESRRHWLNPLFRSETKSTICSTKSPPYQTSTESSSSHSKRNMNRLMRCISQSWNTIKSMPSVSSFASRDDKEVVMEGYLPTTKRSLLDFLKGMGLKPKVELVGKETIITADTTQIRDEALKHRFIKFMKKQVIDTPHTSQTEATTSVASTASSKASSAPSGKSVGSSKDSSRTSQSSEPMAQTKKGKIWTPPKQESLGEAEDSKKDKKKTGKKKKSDPIGGPGKPDDKKSPSDDKKDDTCTKKDEKKKEKSVGFKTVGMVPVVKLIENPFERQIPIGDHILMNEEEQKNESVNVNYPNPYGRSEWYEMNKACSSTRPQSVPDQSCEDQLNEQLMVIEGEPPTTNQKKKKLRIMKHIRKWFSKKKDTRQTIAVEMTKDTEHPGKGRPSNVLSKEIYEPYPIRQFQTVSVAPEPDRVPVVSKFYTENKHGGQRNDKLFHEDEEPVTAKLYVDCHHQNMKKSINKITKGRPKEIKINPQVFDGSISMPVLITPDQSRFKAKQDSTNLLEASKSSTLASENCKAQDSYSVVGDSAAIHIGKKRIRLEGKDIKYGSILQKDEEFDKHFRVLKENSLSDIENQVKKAKERIMFARAMGAVGDQLPEGAPKVDYKELLIPKKNQEKRTFGHQSHVDVATTSSFYQKFLASMNIMKTTHRFNACDRSIMTDEPLSKTYAEFISIMNERNSPREKPSPVSGHSSKSFLVTTGDSSTDLPAASYLKMICTCWEPLLKLFTDSHNEQPVHSRKPPGNRKTEEEKMLKCIVDKVLDCSKNKRGYIKTDIKSH